MRMRVALRMACGLLLLALLFRPGAARAFAGEEVMQAAGFPALVKFIPGDPQRPLVVFIPGAHHTARIAYGGHQGSRAEDFLAYWLVKEGYNFLGISYPIETARPVMQGVYPTYSAQDWGRQAAGIAKREIDAHHLGNRIIVIGWSMGGRIAEPISAAARADGLDLDFFVSFSATPGMTGLVSMTLNIAEAPDGYADRFNLNAGFLKQLSVENAMNGHTIIDQESYLNDYVGKMPVNLEGYGLHYRDGHFVRDHWADAQDFRVYDFGSLPYVAMLMPNEPLDSRHTLTDRANWGLLLANKIAADIDQAKIDVTKLPREKWFALMDLVRSAPDRLSVEMNGDHFFFVGEIGAHETARAIRTMEERMHGFKEQLAALLGTAAH